MSEEDIVSKLYGQGISKRVARDTIKFVKGEWESAWQAGKDLETTFPTLKRHEKKVREMLEDE